MVALATIDSLVDVEMPRTGAGRVVANWLGWSLRFQPDHFYTIRLYNMILVVTLQTDLTIFKDAILYSNHDIYLSATARRSAHG